MTRWQRLQLAGPFNDWVGCVEKVRGNRAVLRKAKHRITRVVMAGAFSQWNHSFHATKAEAAVEVRGARLLARRCGRQARVVWVEWRRAALAGSSRLVWPARYCAPRHPAQVHPSIIELNGIL